MDQLGSLRRGQVFHLGRVIVAGVLREHSCSSLIGPYGVGGLAHRWEAGGPTRSVRMSRPGYARGRATYCPAQTNDEQTASRETNPLEPRLCRNSARPGKRSWAPLLHRGDLIALVTLAVAPPASRPCRGSQNWPASAPHRELRC